MRVSSYLFGVGGGATALADLGLLVLRVFSGVVLATHGYGKLPPAEGLVRTVAGLGFPAPEFFAWSAGLAELVGGILLALGLLTRPAAAFLLFTMLVAAFGLHGADPFAKKELALLYAAATGAFLLAGPGRFSIDALIARSPGDRDAASGPPGRLERVR